VDDAEDIWNLVTESGVLDHNSSYCYLVLCKYFAKTCVTVRQGQRLAGFLTALALPDDASRLFVWQIGVAATDRGCGLATQMLRQLLQRPACRGISHLETTVSPDNLASRALFTALARDLNSELAKCETYPPALFAEPNHLPEQRLLVGPFDATVLSRADSQT
jgi:L-2,4-diaminobutyric acid acetyltransferase